MTPHDAKFLQPWRAEIEAELAAARATLPERLAAHESAAAEVRELTRSYRDLLGAFDALERKFAADRKYFGSARRLAEPLVSRLRAHQDALEPAKTHAAQAKNAVEAARAQIAELELALAQLDQVIAPEAEAAA